MVTIGILALLIAIVAPKFSLDKTSVKAVSQQAESLFIYAKQQSIAQQKEITVLLTTNNGKLTQMSVVDYSVGTGNVLDVYTLNDEIAITFNIRLTKIIFSPTQPIKIKDTGSATFPNKPVNIYFTGILTSPNLVVFPNSGRILRN